MISKKEFRELSIEEQVELVNNELKEAKGTKNFGKMNLDFSYGFARTILTSNNYETLDETTVDGIKIKLFRKMNEDEVKEKEEKLAQKAEVLPLPVENTTPVPLPVMQSLISSDMYEKNKNIPEDKKTKSRNIPVFEDTYEEFSELIKSDEFKLYEKKYIIELMFRLFIEKYKKEEEQE